MLLILLINCVVCVFFGVSLLLILSVFCVVIFWFALGWEGGGVYVAHLVSFLCCVIMFIYWGSLCSSSC
jgi:hypothetical protein